MALTLTGYGGVGEIGGNSFVLDDGKTRLLLDAGRRFGAATVEYQLPESYVRRPGFGDYFDAFLKARSFAAARDLQTLDLVPRLPTLYRTDLGGQAGERPVDAICITHAHQDHFGLLGLIRTDIPVLASQETVSTFANLQETSPRGWETDLLDMQLRGGVGYTKAKSKTEGPKLTVNWRYGDDESGPGRPFLQEPAQVVGDWEISHAPVDHSIQGAVGFVAVRKDGFKLVYTGDFRAHGRRPELTERFLKLAEDPDVLMVEGTRVRRASDEKHDHAHGAAPKAKTDSENAVELEIEALIAAHEKEAGPGFVGIGYPMRDVDRLVSIWNVARRLGRRLVLQPKQAHLLQTLARTGRTDIPDPLRDRNLAVFVKAQGKGTVLRRGGPLLMGNKLTLAMQELQAPPDQWIRLVSTELDKWERVLLGAADEDGSIQLGDNVVTPLDVAAAPRDYLFTLSYWNMTDLFDLFPDRSLAKGLYIHSQTQPFNDDLELVMFKLTRWIKAFNLAGPEHTHVSGHAGEETLHAILESLKPKTLVPVHSEQPGMTATWYSDRIGRKALLPHPGQALTLD
ncbi:MAG: ribonuclease [Thermoplasmata archaeon]|nr:ribonuclease [Thermoplasmata archaeon]